MVFQTRGSAVKRPVEPDANRKDAPRHGWRIFGIRVIAVCSWFSLALVVGAWGLLRAGDLCGPATAVMFGPRWLLAFPPALLIPVAAVWRRRSLGPTLLALLLTLGPVMGFCVPWGRLWAGTSPALHVRVLTCNMHHGAIDPAQMKQFLADFRPDIVALQESREAALIETFNSHEWQSSRTSGHFLASHFPVRSTERVGSDSVGKDGSIMRYEVETAFGIATIFSLHFATPRDGLQHVARDGWQGMADLDVGSALRREQSEGLAAQAGRVAGPVVLLGDFNTPPESAIFRRVWAPYTDAFAAAGWGWGYSFSTRRVAVRIDHILIGGGLRCDSCWVGPDVGSPHRPVLADVTLAGN